MLTLQQESRDCRQTTSLDEEIILERRESTAESDLFEGSPGITLKVTRMLERMFRLGSCCYFRTCAKQ